MKTKEIKKHIDAITDLPQSKLYQGFFAQNSFVEECLKKGLLYRTYWKGKYTENSCSFMDMEKKVEKSETCRILKEIFGITNSIFDAKYQMAISGDGQEYRRISTLHSSSLIALLCFYSLSKESPLKMNIEGHEIDFYKSCFEYKNFIGKDTGGRVYNSNMDVVLVGVNKQGESVILFLESKFSEYLSHNKIDKISAVYDDVYNELTTKQSKQPIAGLEIFRDNDEETWSISAIPNRPQQYCHGIKQMISHYQGIQNDFIKSVKNTYDHIYLGEILFKFPEVVDARHNSYNSYAGLYKQLAQKLNSMNSCKKFKMIETSLSYQDVLKNFDLDAHVRDFYELK